MLIAKGFQHDVSKFYGIEWDYMHAGPDVSKDGLGHAIKQHTRTNEHHPEFWGGIENMPDIAVAEMVCDWYARAQEFGTGLRDWIVKAVDRFKIDDADLQRVNRYVDIILENSFVK